ncbi:MAG: S1 RNA-binding domain-containing protein [Clostridia bacterium]|nr:S1 RNA-binding domain-containing protein [Clostridia bacterium]
MSEIYLPEGELLSLPENREYLSSLPSLERAMREGRILESTVLFCDSSMRLHVELGGLVGIMERSEVVFCRPGESIKDIAVITRVGKPICFKVIGFSEENGVVTPILSRRAAQEECNRVFLSALRAGDIIRAKVTHLESFGAFLDIGCGLSSLLTVDCISVSRIAHPKDRLSVGDKVNVVVKSREIGSGRIYVSMRELLGTWEENAAAFEIGQTVTGIVRSIESYGVFIELSPNLAGLAELKEEGGAPDRAIIGSAAAVYIKSILPDRMKIKLVLIDASRAQAIPQRQPLKYYVDCEKLSHISRWRYSPERAHKIIESVFD